ncbi:glutathione s-transferase [Nesidiocoris tenuis]|uniref:Glutathione s-transferase n=1 Tax=Nesidiocoris tenuis TaxID=355587 RepID=A0ABN7AX03_9HEMI|nr:glutathione s-transferase [Nesidiocoris tenuis]
MSAKLGSRIPFKFYYDNLSQPCRALEVFFKRNQVAYEPKMVNLGKMEHMTEEFGKLNPFQKVPVIDDDGFVLTESVAIFRHICRTRKIDDNWYPADAIARAKVDEYIEWQHIGIRAPCALFAFAVFFTPKITGQAPNPRQIEARKTSAIKACDDINDVWLNGKQFVAGEQISFADLLAACELQQLLLTDLDPKEGRPNLAAWMERVRQLTNPHFDEAAARLVKISKKHASSKL